MLLETEDADRRLNSPHNLMNRLKALRSTDNGLPFKPSDRKDKITVIPSRNEIDVDGIIEKFANVPAADDLIDNLETKLLYGQAHNKALGLLVKSLDMVSDRLTEIDKPERIAKLSSEMNKIIHVMALSKAQHNMGNQVNIQIYAPSHRDERSYDIVQVND